MRPTRNDVLKCKPTTLRGARRDGTSIKNVVPSRLAVAFVLALAIFLPCAACGQIADSDDGSVDASSDVPNDSTAPPDAATDATNGVDAGDAGGDADADAEIGDGAPHIQSKCADPTNCDSGAPVCCAKLTFDNSDQKCLLDTLNGYCSSASGCPTSVQPFCGGDELVRQCDDDTDCVEQGYPKCCTFYFDTTFTQSQTGLRVCTNQQAAEAADADCSP